MTKQRWFDRNHVEIFEGDTIRNVDTGEEELVYECHPEGRPDKLSLGINASNERYLELHPEKTREIYPFSGFFYTFQDGDRCLTEYERVV